MFRYGCETWFVTLRRAIGPQRDEITRVLSKWQNEEIQKFYWLQNIIRKKSERSRTVTVLILGVILLQSSYVPQRRAVAATPQTLLLCL